MSSDESDDAKAPAAAGSTERPGAIAGPSGTETITPDQAGGALGGRRGSGDYDAGRGRAGGDLAGTPADGAATAQPSSDDDGERRGGR